MTAPAPPACRFCREGAPSYYVTCPGCQGRRAEAMRKFHNTQRASLPAPSVVAPRKI